MYLGKLAMDNKKRDGELLVVFLMELMQISLQF